MIDCDLPEEVIALRHPALWAYLQSGVKLGARSGADADVPAGSMLVGYPLMSVTQFHRLHVILKRLPEMYSKLQPLLGAMQPQAGSPGDGPQ